MTEISQAPVPAPATPAAPAAPVQPAHEGPLEHVADWFRGHGQHAAADVESVAADSRAFLTGHASGVLDLTGDVMALLKLVDPADTALFEAVTALVPKAVTSAGSALTIISSALKAA